METKREPYKLTITLDDAGPKAEAVYRTRVFGDDGLVDAKFEPVIEPVRLADVTNDFPWKEFIDAATQASLTDVAASREVAATANTEAKVKTDECAAHVATIAALEAKIKELENAKTADSPAA